MTTQEDSYNDLSGKIIEVAISVHKELGPGLMESIYEVCMIKALKDVNLNVKSQVSVPIHFRGERLAKHFIIDLIVEDKLYLSSNQWIKLRLFMKLSSCPISDYRVSN